MLTLNASQKKLEKFEMNKRNINKYKIYMTFRNHSNLTRKDIIEICDVSRSTVNKIINDFLDKGIIKFIKMENSTGGRPSEKYSLNSKYKLALGIDLVSPQVNVALTDLLGSPIDFMTINLEKKLSHNASPKEVIDYIINKSAKFFKDQFDISKLFGIGFGLPGIIDNGFSTIISRNLKNWESIPLKTLVKENENFNHIDNYAVELGKDVSLMLHAELKKQSLLNNQNIFYIALRKGDNNSPKLGSSIAINGKLAAKNMGSITHFPTSYFSELCRCGNKGCLEKVLYDRVKNLSEIEFDDIEVIDEILSDIIAGIIFFLDIQLCFINLEGINNENIRMELFNEIKQNLKSRLRKTQQKDCRIKQPELYGKKHSIGGATYVLENTFDDINKTINIMGL